MLEYERKDLISNKTNVCNNNNHYTINYAQRKTIIGDLIEIIIGLMGANS